MSILIFGHKNPDTDSVCSALAYSYLKNTLGFSTVACVLGEIKSEAQFVLNYFNQPAPEILTDVYTQISDLAYNPCEGINARNSYVYAYKKMEENHSNTIAVLSDDEKLIGILTIKDIAMELISGDFSSLDTYFINLKNQLEATVLYSPADDFQVTGSVLIATDAHENIAYIYNENHIVISGDINNVNEKLLRQGIRLLIICSETKFPETLIALAKENNIPVLQTSLGTYHVSKLMQQCNTVDKIMKKDRIISFNVNDIVDEVKDEMLSSNYRNYPITNNNNQYIGFINRKHLLEAKKKKVILLDHNEYAQSVEGIKEAEVLEIIDHHKLGGMHTINPIEFTNSPVGSTCTLIYEEYQKNQIPVPYQQAGLLISGILSDTLMFKSPTCTKRDIDAVKSLNKILNLDLEGYFSAMYRAASQISSISPKEILYTDYKEFNHGNVNFSVSQIFTSDIEYINKIYPKLLDELESIKYKSNFDFAALVITDILSEGSYILCTKEYEKIVSNALNAIEISNKSFAHTIVSRKKQIIPQLIKNLELK